MTQCTCGHALSRHRTHKSHRTGCRCPGWAACEDCPCMNFVIAKSVPEESPVRIKLHGREFEVPLELWCWQPYEGGPQAPSYSPEAGLTFRAIGNGTVSIEPSLRWLRRNA